MSKVSNEHWKQIRKDYSRRFIIGKPKKQMDIINTIRAHAEWAFNFGRRVGWKDVLKQPVKKVNLKALVGKFVGLWRAERTDVAQINRFYVGKWVNGAPQSRVEYTMLSGKGKNQKWSCGYTPETISYTFPFKTEAECRKHFKIKG